MFKRFVAIALVILFTLTGCSFRAQVNTPSQSKAATAAPTEKEETTLPESEVSESTSEQETEVEPTPEPTPEQDEIFTVTLAATGDNLIHQGVYNRAYNEELGTYDFNYMYDHIREKIQSYDIAVINQETIFVSDRDKISTYPCFGTPSEMGEAIVNAGFDVVLSATNHTWDKAEYGVNTMLSYWQENYPEITLLGIHDSVEDYECIDYIKVNNIKIALFNYTYGLNGFTVPDDEYYMVDLLDNKEKFLDDVRKAEDNADITICFPHMGDEYQYKPNEFQINYAKELIDAGADVLICSHPHVIEPYTKITTEAGNTGVVFFSCGNLTSTQDEIPRLLGGLAEVTITKTQNSKGSKTEVTSFNFIPTVTHYDWEKEQVYFLEDYTDELAAQHSIRNKDARFNTEYLWNLWNNVIYTPVE